MKKTVLLFVTIVCFLSISGCFAKKQTTETEVEHQQLLWHNKREKPFGTFDYPKITEKEATDLLENKFKVNSPKLMSQVKVLLKEEVATEGMQTGEPEYTMYATGDELKIRAYFPLNEGEELRVFALVDLKYTYNKEQQEVRLNAQSFSMTTYGEKVTYPKDNFDELLAKSAAMIDLSEEKTKHAIKNFKTDYQEIDKRPIAAKAVIYSNDKEAVEKKKVSQELLGGFDSNKELKEIYATIVDYTE